jgi:putative membrane protein
MAMMWDGPEGSWGMYGGGGWIALILLFTLVAGAVAALVVAMDHSHAPGGAPPSRPGTTDGTDSEADRILQRRFAAGEIDEDEYRRRRALLHDRL